MVDAPTRSQADNLEQEIFGEACQIRKIEPRQRFLLRCEEPAKWGDLLLALPINRYAEMSLRRAARLGPDEYWLFAPMDVRIKQEMALGLTSKHHALIDVSHAYCGLQLTGTRIGDIINAGCPLDLGLTAFPVQAATRTLLGKISVIIMREAENCFKVECARSSLDYARRFLRAAAQEYGD